jgi:hypothetical protein
MPQENISFNRLFKANATSPQLPEIYVYRTAILQRAITFSGLFNLPIPVPILDVSARLGVARLETGGSIFPTCNSTSAPARTPQVFSHRLPVEPKPPFYTVQTYR